MIELLLALALSAPAPARLISTAQGPVIAWDYRDADLVLSATNATGTVTRFEVRFNAGAAIDAGLPVLSTGTGSKTYGIPVPASVSGTFTASIVACATWTPATITGSSCGDPTTVTLALPQSGCVSTVRVHC